MYIIGLLEIREDIVTSVFDHRSPNNDGEYLPASWIEGETAQDNLYHVGLQHFSCDDLIYMTGGTQTVRAMPVTVFSFTLLGSCVHVCPPEQFSGRILPVLLGGGGGAFNITLLLTPYHALKHPITTHPNHLTHPKQSQGHSLATFVKMMITIVLLHDSV